jgi:hypothetical protein
MNLVQVSRIVMRKEILLVLILLWACIPEVTGQDPPKKRIEVKKGLLVVLRDTSFITQNDTVLILSEDEAAKMRIKANPHATSTLFYDSMRKKSSGSRATQDIFNLVVRKKKRKEILVTKLVKSEEAFKPFAGFTIGSIVFKHVDLLEGSVNDTLQKATSQVAKFVNHTHTDTRARIIEQNLIFEVGDAVDPYAMADNERILRQFKTLRDAKIYVSMNDSLPNVVDVTVVTQDVASIGFSGSYSSPDKFRLDIFDVNILGYAKQLQVSYFRSADYTPAHGYEVTFQEPNLSSTFIRGSLQYTENYIRQRGRLVLSRDFLTPEMKYAGGLDIYRTREKFYFEAYDTLQIPYTENGIDLWTGRSFQLRKRVNFIIAARGFKRNFTDKPFVSADSNSFFHERTLVLGSVSLAKSNFLKSYRIRSFGKTEDIPVGGSISIIGGKEFNEFIDRHYLELIGTFGEYFPKFGYVNLACSLGSFFKDGNDEDGQVGIAFTYFSDLAKQRKKQIRQFVYFTYTRGFNRILDQTIDLEGKWEDSADLPPLGNQRMMLAFETVYFMPWYVYGFQFALFHRVDLNLLSSATLWDRTALFPIFRAGIRTLNEYLVIPQLSFSLAYYGRNPSYQGAWEFRVSTRLPNLFGARQTFKPSIAGFN